MATHANMGDRVNFMSKEPEQPDPKKDAEETNNVSLSTLPQAQDVEIIPFRDPALLEQFLDQPLTKIAEGITGALSLGRSDAVLLSGRLVQAALKGKIFQQWAREMKQLIEKGKINEDYAETRYGFKSLAELLEFIASEVPDEDRLKAVKSMFVALNSPGIEEGEQIVRYQLFQISKRLSGSQLLTIKATYSLSKRVDFAAMHAGAKEWLTMVSKEMGHNVLGLVERDDSTLITEGLITDRQHPDRSGIDGRNARLSDLGIKFCEYLVKYEDG